MKKFTLAEIEKELNNFWREIHPVLHYHNLDSLIWKDLEELKKRLMLGGKNK